MTALFDVGTSTCKHSYRAHHAMGYLCRRLVVIRSVNYVSLRKGRAGRNSYGSVAFDPASGDRHVCVLWCDAPASRKH